MSFDLKDADSCANLLFADGYKFCAEVMRDAAVEIEYLRAELAACKSDCATLAAVVPEIVKEALT